MSKGVNIFRYVDGVKLALQEVINSPENEDLSDLSLRFDYGHLPDYSNPDVQLYYLFRFAFGYTYIYKCMYERILGNAELQKRIENDYLEILSIGCGDCLDYMGLLYALTEMGKEEYKIKYSGIDCIEWRRQVYGRRQDKMCPQIMDIFDYLDGQDSLTDDVIIFPFSISEFKTAMIQRICQEIADKTQKDDFYIMATVRKNSRNKNSEGAFWDIKKIDKIKEYMESAGFKTVEDLRELDKEKEAKQPITFPNVDKVGEELGLHDYQINYNENIVEKFDSGDGKHKDSTTISGSNSKKSDNGIKSLKKELESKCSKLYESPMSQKTSIRYRILHFAR